MQLILFSKFFGTRSLAELADFGAELGLDGFDLCVRPGHQVTPENVAEALPRAVEALAKKNLAVPLITAHGELRDPTTPESQALVAAAGRAGVGRIKLGYFCGDPAKMSYAREGLRVRELFARWAELGARHGVKICYHTHSGRFLGQNAGGARWLVEGLDPRHFGIYLDAGHLCAEGEEFAVGVSLAGEYLACVSLKDVLLERIERHGHGAKKQSWVEAGQGLVDWTAVFAALRQAAYAGPLSVHCEFEVPPERFDAAVRREVAFFRKLAGKE